MYYHRLCPSGTASYQAPNFTVTAMNFTAAALAPTNSSAGVALCDWGAMSLSPPNVSADQTMEAVAQFEYAMALVVQKEWGTGEYMLSHQQRAESIAQHFEGVQTQVLALGTNQTAQAGSDTGSGTSSGTGDWTALESAVVSSLDQQLPIMMHVGSQDRKHYHDVAVDGYRHNGSSLVVHLNIGHSGFDDGWYSFREPICLRHYKNGTTPADGGSTSSGDGDGDGDGSRWSGLEFLVVGTANATDSWVKVPSAADGGIGALVSGSHGQPKLRALFADGPPETSLVWLPPPVSRWLVFNIPFKTPRLSVRAAPALTGPWSDEVAVFNISTPWVDPKGSSFSYSPKVHAEMATATAAAASEAGAEGAEAEAELIVTFMSNADGRTVADDTLLYVPQPLRLRVGGAAGLRLP
eukprot:g1107.t1